MKFQKTILSVAMVSAMGISAMADATILTASWTGAYTVLNAAGLLTLNTDTGQCYSGMLDQGFCARTAVSGTLTYDTTAGTGSAAVVPFSFFGIGLVTSTNIHLQAIGNGMGGSGPLVLGNMGFNWSQNYSIPINTVYDATGFFGAIAGGLTTGQTITGVGALPASNNTVDNGQTYPVGPALLATTTWNTTDIGTPTPGSGATPSGTLPIITDTVVDLTNGDIGIGGSPMRTPPFAGFNVTFDITSMTITSVVPVPAAVWLFGSGLLGLVGMARRKAD